MIVLFKLLNEPLSWFIDDIELLTALDESYWMLSILFVVFTDAIEFRKLFFNFEILLDALILLDDSEFSFE